MSFKKNISMGLMGYIISQLKDFIMLFNKAIKSTKEVTNEKARTFSPQMRKTLDNEYVL